MNQTIFLVIYNGLDNTREVQKLFTTYRGAEVYILSNGGWSSEIHSFEIQEEVVS